MRHLKLVNEGLASAQDSISQTGNPKRLSNSFYVKFPQDRGRETTITTYGKPYVENGQTYIDFKIWNREWDTNDRLLNDRESVFLRRMSLENFLDIGRANFKYFKSTVKYL